MVGIGALLVFTPLGHGLGKLPGDILVKRGNATFYFPLATSILISVVLTLLFWLISRK